MTWRSFRHKITADRRAERRRRYVLRLRHFARTQPNKNPIRLLMGEEGVSRSMVYYVLDGKR